MPESMWLKLDTNVFRRAELKNVDTKAINVYLMLVLRAAKNPWWQGRPDIIPCDKGILAKATGCDEESIKDTLNAFKKLGLVTLVKQSQLEVDSSSNGVPTVGEVLAFAEENAPDVDVRKFYDYYAESGFRYKGKPVDWKAKLEEWQKNERPKSGKKLPTPKEWGEEFEKMYTSRGYQSMTEYLDSILDRI